MSAPTRVQTRVSAHIPAAPHRDTLPPDTQPQDRRELRETFRGALQQGTHIPPPRRDGASGGHGAADGAPKTTPETTPDHARARAQAPKRETGPNTDRTAWPGTVLMATYQGQAHLGAQLDSLARQSHTDWHLIASDDGSRDATPTLLAAFAQAHPERVTLREGPRAGDATAHFFSLLDQAPTEAPWTAFADQDDVWLPQKLSRAAAALAPHDVLPPGAPARPVLYACQILVADAQLARRRPGAPWRRPAGFGNALVENIAPGHAMVLNAAALRAVQASLPAARAAGVPFHDWWCYLVVTGLGGTVLLDAEPGVIYRQHSGNVVGHGRPWRQPLRVLAGRFSERVGRNLAALEALETSGAPETPETPGTTGAYGLCPEARQHLAAFAAARAAPSPLGRLRGLHASGVWRQSLRGRLGLWGAMALGKV